MLAARQRAHLGVRVQRVADADRLCDRDEARQELESMREDASIRGEADLRLGKLAYQMGDLTEAGRRFGSLISSPAEAPEAFFYLSSIAEREGRAALAKTRSRKRGCVRRGGARRRAALSTR